MFSRIVLRRIDPAAQASGRRDDIENQPLTPCSAEFPAEPEMGERPQGRLSRLMPRRPAIIPSSFRFSNSTEATSAAGSDWPADAQAAALRALRATTTSSHYPEDDDAAVFDDRAPSPPPPPLPARYSVAVDLSSTRLHLPGLQRTWTAGSNGPPPRVPQEEEYDDDDDDDGGGGGSGGGPPARPPRAATRLGSAEADELYRTGDRRARGGFTDPAEVQLAHMAEDGRQRRRRRQQQQQQQQQRGGSWRRRRRHHGHRQDRAAETPAQREERRRRRRERRQRSRGLEEGGGGGGGGGCSARPRPRRFLFCFPWIASRRVRSHILQCFVSGTFLLLLLGVYLALATTNNIANTEFSVLLILIILFATVFFFQGLIRACLLVFRPRPTQDERRHARLPQMPGPAGYAVPRRPIRVVLARDEEAAGIESETAKISPPAYGLWRESVRVDPNRIYWQRTADAPPAPALPEAANGQWVSLERGGGSSSPVLSSVDGEESTSATTRHPPSYVSEDGVSYVLDARPRSTMAPGPGMVALPSPLPVHPAELGRVAMPPSR